VTTTRVVIVSAGLRTPSSTRLLADQLGLAVEAAVAGDGRAVERQTIELREHAHAIADALLTGFPAGALRGAVDAVLVADVLVVVSPTFSASYSGLFKSFFDLFEAGALPGAPTLLAATGGTERHSLVLEHALRPLFVYLGASPVRTGVYAATSDFGGEGALRLEQRIRRAAREVADLVSGLPPPVRSRDPLDDVVPFEELLSPQAPPPASDPGNDGSW
jgi:FMN reductase